MMILCVDDDQTALTVRRLILSIAGYTVLEATSAKAAFMLFNSNHVDLVITDHLLPDGTGAEMTFKMKRLKPDVPVVLLTGWMERPPGYDHADVYLTKGIEPQEFLAALETVVSAKNS